MYWCLQCACHPCGHDIITSTYCHPWSQARREEVGTQDELSCPSMSLISFVGIASWGVVTLKSGTSDVSNRELSPGGLGLKVTGLSVDRKAHVGTWKVEADRRRLQGHPGLHRILSPMKQNIHVKDQVGLICFESWLISCLCYKSTSVIPTPPPTRGPLSWLPYVMKLAKAWLMPWI